MRRVIIVIVVLVVVGTGVALWIRSRRGTESNPQELQTAQVRRGAVVVTVSADGVVRPLTTVVVKSYAGGRVDELAVEVGDRVKAGDLIAKIDPTDSLTAYEQAVADLTAAQARLSQAQEQAAVQPALTRASIAQAEASYNSALKDLERMQEATHPQSRAQARAALDKAKANLQIAEKELIRTQGLKDQGFVPQSELDTALNRRDLAEAELASVQERWDTLQREQATELAAAQARVVQAKASLERAQTEAVNDRLRRSDVASAKAQVARAQAEVENTRTMLDYTTITAPRAGVILQKFVEQGTIITSGRSAVAQGTDIVELGDLTQMFVQLSLDEAEVGKVRVGQPVEIRVEAFPDEVLQGMVTRINPQAVTQQNITTVEVTVKIESADERLKPGMTASCDFLVERVEDTLYLPSRAVREVGGEHVVTLLRNKQQVEVPVQVGLVGDDRTEVLEGVREGDRVVLPGLLSSTAGSFEEQMRQRMRRAGGVGGLVR